MTKVYKEEPLETIKEEPFESIPGLNEMKLDSNTSINGGGGGTQVGTLTFTRASTVGTGNQSFTGFGFTPTNYSIVAWRDATGDECNSNGGIDGAGTQWGFRTAPSSAGGVSESASTNKVLRIFFTNAGGGETNASHVSYDSDGITLIFNLSAENIKFTLTCYG